MNISYKTIDEKIELTTPCGQKVIMSKIDEDILTEFSCFGISGSRSKYCFLERSIDTKYGCVRQRIYLHKAIGIKVFGLAAMKHRCIDHRNRDRFDNTRSNLRLASTHQNMCNVERNTKSNTGYRGVTKTNRKLEKKFIGGIKNKKKYFSTAIEAAKYYDKIAKEEYGEFAILNFK